MPYDDLDEHDLELSLDATANEPIDEILKYTRQNGLNFGAF